MLGHLDPAFFLKLRQLTLGKLDNIISEELHQLYQVELILRLEAPDLGLDTSHIQDSHALLAGFTLPPHPAQLGPLLQPLTPLAPLLTSPLFRLAPQLPPPQLHPRCGFCFCPR